MDMWNPWHGCHKCSPGCKNCYVFYLDSLRNKDANVITKSKTNFNMPLKKDKYGNFKLNTNKEVATCFTSDFFIEEADEWRSEAWEIIKQRNDIRFLICTKRIERFEFCKPTDWGDGYNNVSIAVTCENQQKADERLPIFLKINAKRKYIFASPLLEDVDFSKYLSGGEIDMVSVGGESYKFARECRFEWVKHIKTDCDKYGVAFDYHQTGSNFVMNNKRYRINHHDEYKQAKKAMEYMKKEENHEN